MLSPNQLERRQPKMFRLLMIFYLSSLQFFSNQLAVPKNLRSSSLFPTNCTPNGKSFSPVSKGSDIVGNPR